MESVDIFNNFIKFLFLGGCIYYTHFRCIDYNELDANKLFKLIIFAVFISTINTIVIFYISSVLTFPLIYFAHTYILSYITQSNFNYSIIVTSLAYLIVYCIYFVAITIAFLIFSSFTHNIPPNSPIVLLLLIPITLFFIFSFFRISKFKKGIYFLKNTTSVEYFGNIVMFFTIILFLFYGFIKYYSYNFVIRFVYGSSIIVGVGIFLWLRSQIFLHYKSRQKDTTIKIQEIQLDEHTQNSSDLEQELLQKETLLHDYRKRIISCERAIQSILNNAQTEFSSELTIMKEDLKIINNELSSSITNTSLPKTGILSIDNVFEQLNEDCINSSITFKLVLKDALLNLIENPITKSELEILFINHITNSIIAINNGDNTTRNITLLIGIEEGIYQLTFIDSGIPFEINTLVKLGLEKATTHKETGGTGIGLMTIYRTLKKYKASLIINELNSNQATHNKSITIKFDGLDEYRVQTSRSKELRAKDVHGRIIIEDM